MRPSVISLTGTGINCELETAQAFRDAGAEAHIVHVVDLLEAPQQLFDHQILALPGGFSYGDDTGSGNALAHRLRHGIGDLLRDFIAKDRLVIGICNGFQVLTHLGILPGSDAESHEREAALLTNVPAGFRCHSVDLDVAPGNCVFLRGLENGLRIPIAHGEGRFYASDQVLDRMAAGGQLVLTYADTPNGSSRDIAGICDPTGRVLGMMPHPERALSFYQDVDWPRLADALRRRGEPVPSAGDGAALFRNAVEYFQ